jgi:hypothetical protein
MKNLKFKCKTISLILILFLLNIKNTESNHLKNDEISLNDQIIGYLTWNLNKTRIPTQSQ